MKVTRPTSPQPKAKRRSRRRPFVTFTISPEAVGALRELAQFEGIAKSAVVERLIRREARAQGLDLDALGKQERKARKLPPTG